MTGTSSKYPLVSIITVNYNQSEVTCDLIESLNGITYPNFEVIVVDNNSTDRTSEVAKKYGAKVVYEKVNQISRARNRGVIESQGDKYIRESEDQVQYIPKWSTGVVKHVTKVFLDSKINKNIIFKEVFQDGTVGYTVHNPEWNKITEDELAKYWYIDDELIETTDQFHEVEIVRPPGSYSLYIQDEKGEELLQHFQHNIHKPMHIFQLLQ